MEGVRIWEDKGERVGLTTEEISKDLKHVLGGLALHLFGPDTEMRWNEDYFPFTEPSYELEVKFEGRWLEVLGCGVIHSEVMDMAGQHGKRGWAFGLGLERLAMVLFGIPDIRLFWSEDERFHKQFRGVDPGDFTKALPVFEPYSRYPGCWKDVSFWLPVDEDAYHQNDVFEVIRGIGGDLVEKVELFDQFSNKKTGRTSHAYRITYRHMDRSLTNEEVDEVQWKVRDALVQEIGVELR
jgi:phenylalanyl-tRNA synthetase alpha chain